MGIYIEMNSVSQTMQLLQIICKTYHTNDPFFNSQMGPQGVSKSLDECK